MLEKDIGTKWQDTSSNKTYKILQQDLYPTGVFITFLTKHRFHWSYKVYNIRRLVPLINSLKERGIITYLPSSLLITN